jgi:hypothetical protein
MKDVRRVKLGDTLRACAAGLGAMGAQRGALSLFEAGGRRLLDAGAQRAVRQLAEVSATTVLGGLVPGGLTASGLTASGLTAGLLPGALGEAAQAGAAKAMQVAGSVGAEQAATSLANRGLRGAAGAIGRVVTGRAARTVSSSARVAAGAGFVIDGVLEGIEAREAYQAGEITGRQAAVRVAIGAATGAAAAGAGVAAAAGIVAVAGALSGPAAFMVGAASSLGARRALRWLFD